MNIEKIIRVQWIDSCSSDRWEGLEDLSFEPIECESCGYLIKDEEKFIVIAHSLGNSPEGKPNQCCGLMAIPKVAISNMIVLENKADGHPDKP